MKTFPHLWQYLAEFFLEWEMFQTNIEKIIANILCSKRFSENCAIYGIMSKHYVEPEGPQMTLRYGAYTLRTR